MKTIAELAITVRNTLDVVRDTYYTPCWVIRSFADRDTERLFNQERVRRFQAFERAALRRLLLLNQARSLNDLKGVGFGLESLKGDRLGQHSIRINRQYRICFVWRAGDAFGVEIADYH